MFNCALTLFMTLSFASLSLAKPSNSKKAKSIEIECESSDDDGLEGFFRVKKNGEVEYSDGWDLLDRPAKGTLTKVAKDVFTDELVIIGTLQASKNKGVDYDVVFIAVINEKKKIASISAPNSTYTWLSGHSFDCKKKLDIKISD